MASINERRNRDGQLIGWQAQVRRKGYPIKTKTFDRRADAQDWAIDTEAQMVRKVFVDRSKAERTTLRQAIENYVREVAPSHKGGDTEVLRLRRFLREESRLADHALASLTTDLFQTYRDSRVKVVAPGTVKRELSLLHTVLEWVRKSHGMIDNPISDVRRPLVKDARDVRLPTDGEQRLLAACAEARNRWLLPAVVLAIETAMRRSELLGMTWDAVDFENLSVRLTETKTGAARSVPLSPRAYETLWSLGSNGLSGSVLKTTPEGIKQSFERARARAGLEHVNFHDLRHEAVSRLFERGWNIMEVAAVSGHQDLSMLKRYTNLRASDLARKLG